MNLFSETISRENCFTKQKELTMKITKSAISNIVNLEINLQEIPTNDLLEVLANKIYNEAAKDASFNRSQAKIKLLKLLDEIKNELNFFEIK